MRWEDLQAAEIGPAFEKANGELHIMRSFMASSNMPAAIKDSNGRILYCNNTAQKMWGLTLAKARGKTLAEVLDLSSKYDDDRQNKKVIREKIPLVFFLLGTTNSGKVISYSLFKFVFYSSDFETLIGMFALPTEFKKADDL